MRIKIDDLTLLEEKASQAQQHFLQASLCGTLGLD